MSEEPDPVPATFPKRPPFGVRHRFAAMDWPERVFTLFDYLRQAIAPDPATRRFAALDWQQERGPCTRHYCGGGDMSATAENVVVQLKPPHGSETRQRERRISLRVTAAEYSEAEALADRAGLSLASYVRARALAAPTTRATRRPSVDKAELARALGLLGRVGGNLAQITRHLNFGRIDGGEGLPEALAAVDEMKSALMAALGRRAR